MALGAQQGGIVTSLMGGSGDVAIDGENVAGEGQREGGVAAIRDKDAAAKVRSAIEAISHSFWPSFATPDASDYLLLPPAQESSAAMSEASVSTLHDDDVSLLRQVHHTTRMIAN